jgi:hypothetical protein
MVATGAIQAAAVSESRSRERHEGENGNNDPQDFDPLV